MAKKRLISKNITSTIEMLADSMRSLACVLEVFADKDIDLPWMRQQKVLAFMECIETGDKILTPAEEKNTSIKYAHTGLST